MSKGQCRGLRFCAGGSKQEFGCTVRPRVSTGRRSSLLVTRPALKFDSAGSLQPGDAVRGKRLNGQSVAIKTAATATTRKLSVLFRCAGAASSFTGRTCTSDLSRVASSSSTSFSRASCDKSKRSIKEILYFDCGSFGSSSRIYGLARRMRTTRPRISARTSFWKLGLSP